jgi:hypothetical protein
VGGQKGCRGIGALALDGSLARSKGLTHRPLAETGKDTLDWYWAAFDSWPEDRRPGLNAARESAVLEAWHRQR